MSHRYSFILVAMIAVALPRLCVADNQTAGDLKESQASKPADIRAILESGMAGHSLPSGVVVRIDADLKRSAGQTKRHAAGPEKTLRETWEFTGNRVHRVVRIVGDNAGELAYRREESISFDSGAICRQLLDAKVWTIGDEEKGERRQFVDTDFDIGHRSIEIFVDGKSVLWTGESCLTAGYAESDAKVFAALYENLAGKARSAFEAKNAEK